LCLSLICVYIAPLMFLPTCVSQYVNDFNSLYVFTQLKLSPAVLEELASSSAFQAFTQHVCILQKVELRGLSINERIQFWCNIFNTIMSKTLTIDIVCF